ncbi:hypothetical protein TIFTF001_030625 [Ficus carica]|uniref:Uncharacterized protein n=1 Tax=Ficus carica TaxID=3494 RepID=A0AA88DXW6_FICCA|nr:hypothetical protein TIFTF001_030625 [Ficus carica]
MKLPFLVAIASPSPSQHEGGENRVCSSPLQDHRVCFSSVPDRRRLQSVADLNVILEPDRSSGESQLLSLTHSSSSGISSAIPAAAFSDSLATLPCCGSRLHPRRSSSPSPRETIMISARNSNSSPDFDDLSASCSPVASLLSPMTAASPVAQWMLWGLVLGMSRIYILVEYNGKWENVDGGFWRCFGVGMSKGFVVDRSINFLKLEETIYDRTSIDRSKYAIEIIHKPVRDIFGEIATPTLISSYSDIKDLMFLYKEKQGMTLHVIIKEKCDKGKAIYVRGDDDLNSDGGDALGFHDDYFGSRINEEIPFVARFVPTKLLSSYEHLLQICAISTPINERITGFNPTPITGSNPTPEV